MPTITLAMIVRNEAPKLGRCLASVQGAVDDIVVVDTGSTDDTVRIAESLNARVSQIAWPGAFDVARNLSLDLVRTEWVLWLDADEWLVEGSANAIRAAVQDEGACGFFLTRRDLLEDGRHSEQLLLRLWRHSPELLFQGAIHEHLDLNQLESLHPGKELKAIPAALWHDGYSVELTREKALRNIPLLEAEIARGPSSIYYQIELAQTLKSLGDDRSREVDARIASQVEAWRDHDEAPDNTLALYLMRYLADLDEQRLRSPRADLFIRLARGWFSNHPGVRYLCAQSEIRRKDLRAALDDLLAIEELARTGEYDRWTSTNPLVLEEGLSTNLALVAHQLGRTEIARRHYERLLSMDPHNALARQNLPQL